MSKDLQNIEPSSNAILRISYLGFDEFDELCGLIIGKPGYVKAVLSLGSEDLHRHVGELV